MSETRDITLGGQTFAVPPLPLRVNRVVYPLCRKLTGAGLIERMIEGGGSLDCTEEEMADLVELAFLAASASATPIDRDALDDLPVTPPELLDAFLKVRYQTGAWVPGEAAAEPGEAQGGKRPRK